MAALLLVLVLGGLCTTVLVLKKVFGPAVTRANAQQVFDAFGDAVKKGEIKIDDDATAFSVAKDSYRKLTDSVPLDGWGREMHLTARVEKNSCTLTLHSAGGDNVFGNSDDVVCEETFDLSRIANPTSQPSQTTRQ